MHRNVVRTLWVVAASAGIGAVAAVAQAPRTTTGAQTALSHTVKNIEGRNVNLSRYRGKVVLIVNVASRCGYTPQYADLQQVYDRYRKKGLVVLGFPSNDFGEQEPGTNAEIKQFCSVNYGVAFPLFAKIVVKGEGQAPLYRFLTSKETNPQFGGEIEWNFTKFLIGRDGKVAGRFPSKTPPTDKSVLSAIESLLDARPGRADGPA